MAQSGCETCSLRAKYDAKPKSLMGMFWRWHINWCPGWKAYIKEVDEQKRQELKLKYHLK